MAVLALPPSDTHSKSVACLCGIARTSPACSSRDLPHRFESGVGMYALSIEPLETEPAPTSAHVGLVVGSLGA